MEDEKDKTQEDLWPDGDKIIYIPDEEYYSFMRSLDNLEKVQKELHRMRDSMKDNVEPEAKNQKL